MCFGSKEKALGLIWRILFYHDVYLLKGKINNKNESVEKNLKY